MRHGIRRETLGHRRHKARQGPSTWAFAEVAVLCLRDPPPAQKDLAQLEKKHSQGKALPVLAHQLARAVYHLLKRQVAFDQEPFFPR
jgi:hypothetical protein